MATPQCCFETLDPRDIASAIGTSRPRSRAVIRVGALGLGYEAFLRWSVKDIKDAASNTDPDQQVRFSVNALMNARRALSCLAEQYLLRDGFAFCRDVPREANGKAELLVHRGLFDELAAGALRRAVERRNVVEHDYKQVTFCDAQDTVHLIRTTIENCVAKSDPCLVPGFFGSFLGGHASGVDGEKHWFDGWSGLLFVLARFDSAPWFGVIVPSSNTEATVRKVLFSELSCDQLLATLVKLEKQSSAGYSEYGERTFAAQLACILGS
jgi:hypothetical protein